MEDPNFINKSQNSAAELKKKKKKKFEVYIKLASQKYTCASYMPLQMQETKTWSLQRKTLRTETLSFSLEASVCPYVNLRSFYQSRTCAVLTPFIHLLVQLQ